MTFLVKLGKYILAPILIEWIELNEYMLLDTALNPKNRKICVELCIQFPNKFQFAFYRQVGSFVNLKFNMIVWNSTRGLPGIISVNICDSFLINFQQELYLCKCMLQSNNKNDIFDIVRTYFNGVKCIQIDRNLRNFNVVRILLTFCCNLEELYLATNVHIDEVLSIVADTCRENLKVCDVEGRPASYKLSTLQKLIINCKQLTHLTLRCDLNNTMSRLYDDLLQCIETHGSSIQHLTMKLGCMSIENGMLFKDELKSLSFDFYQNERFSNYLSSGRGSNLIKLDLAQTYVNKTVLVLVGIHCPLLEYLHLPIIANISPACIVLASCLPSLRVLNCGGNDLNRDAMVAINTHCKLLQELYTQNVFSTLISPNLHVLAIGNIQDSYVRWLGPELGHLHSLISLRVEINQVDTWNDDIFFNSIEDNCPNLVSLYYDSVCRIDVRQCRGKLTQLQHCYLRVHCHNSFTISIINSNLKLKTLEFLCFPTNEANEILSQCTRLTELRLWAALISKKILNNVFPKFFRMKLLVFNSCHIETTRATLKSFEEIVNSILPDCKVVVRQ